MQGCGDYQQPSCLAAQVGDARSHEAQDQQRDDEVQKIAENVVEGQCDSGEPLGNEEAEYDAQRDSQEHFGK